MTSAPVVVQVLEGLDAVKKYRESMGATNPENAVAGTIRKEFAINVQENSVHGSDSEKNAEIEIKYFFDESEIIDWLKQRKNDIRSWNRYLWCK